MHSCKITPHLNRLTLTIGTLSVSFWVASIGIRREDPNWHSFLKSSWRKWYQGMEDKVVTKVTYDLHTEKLERLSQNASSNLCDVEQNVQTWCSRILEITPCTPLHSLAWVLMSSHHEGGMTYTITVDKREKTHVFWKESELYRYGCAFTYFGELGGWERNNIPITNLRLVDHFGY